MVAMAGFFDQKGCNNIRTLKKGREKTYGRIQKLQRKCKLSNVYDMKCYASNTCLLVAFLSCTSGSFLALSSCAY